MLSILALLDRLVNRLARQQRESQGKSIGGEGQGVVTEGTGKGAETAASSSDTRPREASSVRVLKKENDVEDLLLSLAKADAKSRKSKDGEQQSEGPRHEQYTLHMRLTGSDYFTNARYMDEEEALRLDTGEWRFA